MADADEEELRKQFTAAFEGADFPVSSPMDLVPALPDGPTTRFESGDFSMTAMEMNMELPTGDFPYASVEELVDDLVSSLKDEGYL